MLIILKTRSGETKLKTQKEILKTQSDFIFFSKKYLKKYILLTTTQYEFAKTQFVSSSSGTNG